MIPAKTPEARIALQGDERWVVYVCMYVCTYVRMSISLYLNARMYVRMSISFCLYVRTTYVVFPFNVQTSLNHIHLNTYLPL